VPGTKETRGNLLRLQDFDAVGDCPNQFQEWIGMAYSFLRQYRWLSDLTGTAISRIPMDEKARQLV
jgi:hypothetical protein